jgi:hypothetical protein|uniref:hypothetical protein n=1 Tax=Prosthecobacter sp. TaxID=1965333 RepID=UPI0037841DE3
MPSVLDTLITEATRYARFTMKTSGCLAPIMMAATDQGIILFSPDNLSDTVAKDAFANKVRLITGSYGASAVVLILESWITKAKKCEKLDTETPPSESYDREEVVVLIGQSAQCNITHLLPIHRLGNGKFWNLGDAEDMPADSFEGRFSGLLPPKPVDEKTRQMGKVLLEAMGVKIQKLAR